MENTKSANENVAVDCRYTCGFGFGRLRTQLANGVLIVALVGLTLNNIWAIITALYFPMIGLNERIICALAYLFHMFLYSSLIVAHQKRNRRLYLPYLIIQGIGLVLSPIMCLVFIGIAVAASQSWIDDINRRHPEYHMTLEKFRFMFGFSAIWGALSTPVYGCFYSIVYRAYKLPKLDDHYKQLVVDGEH